MAKRLFANIVCVKKTWVVNEIAQIVFKAARRVLTKHFELDMNVINSAFTNNGELFPRCWIKSKTDVLPPDLVKKSDYVLGHKLFKFRNSVLKARRYGVDSKAAVVVSCWLAVAVISAVYMWVFADKVGDVLFGVFLPVGLLVIAAIAVTYFVTNSGSDK